jgi:hypothetical protein
LFHLYHHRQQYHYTTIFQSAIQSSIYFPHLFIMKFIVAFVTLAASAISVNAAAVDSNAHLAQIFQRDLTPRDDPCLTPCYEKTGSYCPSPGGCALQW